MAETMKLVIWVKAWLSFKINYHNIYRQPHWSMRRLKWIHFSCTKVNSPMERPQFKMCMGLFLRLRQNPTVTNTQIDKLYFYVFLNPKSPIISDENTWLLHICMYSLISLVLNRTQLTLSFGCDLHPDYIKKEKQTATQSNNLSLRIRIVIWTWIVLVGPELA